jgi:hypothetical protein
MYFTLEVDRGDHFPDFDRFGRRFSQAKYAQARVGTSCPLIFSRFLLDFRLLRRR